jgi:thiol-disulfide isomerase/thioredoxin
MKFLPFFLGFLLVFVARKTHAAESSPCNDHGKIYKVCSDQEATYQNKLSDAKAQNKMLVVVLGADWCPWCVSLHKMLGSPRFGKGFSGKYELVDVGVYNGKVKVPSGDTILNHLKDQAHYARKIDGIPVLVLVNPQNEKAVLIDTEPLEKNTETKKGHDPKKVLAALEKASEEVN